MIEQQREIPNATATLVLGILSIVFCFCYGLPGIISGVVALVISHKSVRMYKDQPELYTGYGNLKAGRVTAIIGLILSSISILLSIIYFLFLGLTMADLENFGNF